MVRREAGEGGRRRSDFAVCASYLRAGGVREVVGRMVGACTCTARHGKVAGSRAAMRLSERSIMSVVIWRSDAAASFGEEERLW